MYKLLILKHFVLNVSTLQKNYNQIIPCALGNSNSFQIQLSTNIKSHFKLKIHLNFVCSVYFLKAIWVEWVICLNLPALKERK